MSVRSIVQTVKRIYTYPDIYLLLQFDFVVLFPLIQKNSTTAEGGQYRSDGIYEERESIDGKVFANAINLAFNPFDRGPPFEVVAGGL